MQIIAQVTYDLYTNGTEHVFNGNDDMLRVDVPVLFGKKGHVISPVIAEYVFSEDAFTSSFPEDWVDEIESEVFKNTDYRCKLVNTTLE